MEVGGRCVRRVSDRQAGSLSGAEQAAVWYSWEVAVGDMTDRGPQVPPDNVGEAEKQGSTPDWRRSLAEAGTATVTNALSSELTVVAACVVFYIAASIELRGFNLEALGIALVGLIVLSPPALVIGAVSGLIVHFVRPLRGKSATRRAFLPGAVAAVVCLVGWILLDVLRDI
jgi:hypothetical protein